MNVESQAPPHTEVILIAAGETPTRLALEEVNVIVVTTELPAELTAVAPIWTTSPAFRESVVALIVMLVIF